MGDLFFKLLEATEVMIRTLADAVSAEDLLPCSRTVISSLAFMEAEGASKLLRLRLQGS